MPVFCRWTVTKSVSPLQLRVVTKTKGKGYVMTKSTLRLISIGVLSLGLVACGQGMNSSTAGLASQSGGTGNNNGLGNNNGNDTGALEPVPFDVQKVTADVEVDTQAVISEADAAAKEAEQYLNKINIFGGKVRVGDTSSGASRQLILDGIVRKALTKIGDKLEKAPDALDVLRGKLAEKMNQLDASNPLHQAAIAALMTAMAKIDGLESRYGELLGRVADAIDSVVSRLDILAGSVPFPASIVVMIEWPAVKQVLQEFQDRLRNM